MDRVAGRWRKSSRSGSNGGGCVEVGQGRDTVAVRDTQDPAGPALWFSPAAWQRFADRVRSGDR